MPIRSRLAASSGSKPCCPAASSRSRIDSGSQFARPPSDLLLVEEEIAREITDALKLSVAPAVRRRLQRLATASASALELYLKGRYFWNKRSQEALQKAADFFERAIADDPDFALAHAGLADS